MSAKPNYFKIGMFVIVATILCIATVVIFGSGLLTEKKTYFETYFDSSVTGLSVGAPIEYRGVRMGRVEKVTFAVDEYDLEVGSEGYFENQRLIMVVASLDTERLQTTTREEQTANLKQMTARGFRLQLASNLLTGQAFLQGDYLDPNQYPVIDVPWIPRDIYIPSAQGEFSTMKESVDKILVKLEKIDTDRIGSLVQEILTSIVQAIEDANVAELSAGIQDLIADADQTIVDANVAALSGELKSLFHEARQTNQHLKDLLASDKPEAEPVNVAEIMMQLSTILRRIDRLLATQTPQIEQVLEEVRKITRNLEELTEDLKRNPSELIFSKPPPKLEAPK